MWPEALTGVLHRFGVLCLERALVRGVPECHDAIMREFLRVSDRLKEVSALPPAVAQLCGWQVPGFGVRTLRFAEVSALCRSRHVLTRPGDVQVNSRAAGRLELHRGECDGV